MCLKGSNPIFRIFRAALAQCANPAPMPILCLKAPIPNYLQHWANKCTSKACA